MSLQKLFNKMLPLHERLHHCRERTTRFFHPESATEVRTLQIFWLTCGGLLLLLVSYGLVTFLFSSTSFSTEEKKKPVSTYIESALSKIDVHDTWRHKIEQTLETFSQKIEGIEKFFQEGVKKGDFSQIPHSGDKIPEDESLVSDLEGENPQGEPSSQHTPNTAYLQELETKVLELEMKVADQRSHHSSNDSLNNSSFAPSQGSQQEGNIIQKVTLGLSEGTQPKSPKTVETTIPAGAFAKTVLLSGLDASASMSASSDPRPMLLRLIDPGTLPRRFQSDLKDCHCTASAYGDLSSERIYARLEKLSCIERATGEIIETQVAGYIAGADGKAGIRGVVASKDGQFLGRSLVGGIFAGLSNVANPQNRQQQANPFFSGGTVAPPSIGSMFASGMATGATTALDRLSQYYIDRAEQLQPVIQIAAGQVVDIVFTEGTFIGSQNVKEKIESQRDNHQPSETNHQN